jgi:hypothetical protein
VHGEIRTTQDVDVVLDLRPDQVDPLVAALQPAFLIDREFVAQAVRTGSSCNLVHRGSGMKIDFFLLRRRPFSREEMQRGIEGACPTGSGATSRESCASRGAASIWQPAALGRRTRSHGLLEGALRGEGKPPAV